MLLLISYIRLVYKVYFLYPRYYKKVLRSLNEIANGKSELSPKLIEKIKRYTAVACLVNDWLCTLAGEEITKEELYRTASIGAFAAVFDELTDEFHIGSPELMNILMSNSFPVDSTLELKVLRRLYIMLTSENEKITNAFHTQAEKAWRSQEESKIQRNTTKIPDELLREITYNKGGYATNWFCCVLNTSSCGIYSGWTYQLGAFLQLSNDLFDIYIDIEMKQQTLFTNTTDIKEMMAEYKKLLNTCVLELVRLPVYEPAKHKVINQLYIVASRGMVCGKQLKYCQNQSKGVFTAFNYNRKQLVCDMEKPANIIASILEAFKLKQLNRKRQ